MNEHQTGAIESEPRGTSRGVALSRRGLVRMLWGNLDQGEADLREARRLARPSAEVHYNVGVARARLHQHREAVGSFSEAVARNPNFAEAYRNRASVYGLLDEMFHWSADRERFYKLVRRRSEARESFNTNDCPTFALLEVAHNALDLWESARDGPIPVQAPPPPPVLAVLMIRTAVNILRWCDEAGPIAHRVKDIEALPDELQCLIEDLLMRVNWNPYEPLPRS